MIKMQPIWKKARRKKAFGCLMEDLLNQNFETTNSLKDSLIQLKDSCMQEEILKRPSFEMICNYFLQRR